MNTDSLRRLLNNEFYEYGLRDAKEMCFSRARSGNYTVSFFALGNIFRDLENHFESMAPITTQESQRFASIYKVPMTQLLDSIDTDAPTEQIASHLDHLVMFHITAHL